MVLRRPIQQTALSRMASGLGTAIGLLATTGGALGQTTVDTRMERDTVNARSRPGFEAVGIAFGSFRLQPTVGVQAIATDNLYARSDVKVSDVSVSVRPAVSLQSQWKRHALALSADAAFDRHFAHATENVDRFDVGADGRIDVSAATRISGDVSFARRVEGRGTTGDTLFGAKPIAYHQLSGGVSVEQDFFRTKISVQGQYDRYRYSDRKLGNITIDLSPRNYEAVSGELRVAQGLTPGIAAFTSLSFNHARYPVQVGGTSRNSKGYTALGGLAFGLNRLLQGEIGAGYLRQTFDNPLFPTISGLNYHAQLRWSPTRLTTVNFSAGKSVQRSPLINIAGIEQQIFALSADHELLRNLNLRPAVTYTISKYRGFPRRDHYASAQFAVVWLLNDRIQVDGLVGHVLGRNSDPTQTARQFDQNRVTLGVTYKM